MTTQEEMNKFRTTARVVGAVYLAGFVVGIVGNIMIQSILGPSNHLATISASGMKVAIGAILWLLAVVGDAGHGVLMFPVLKQHSERMAIGYLAARIVDAIFIAVMVLFMLIQLPLGSEYLKAAASDASFLQALSALGVSGLMLCYTLYKAKLVPAWLAIWGLVGYATILFGMVSAIIGSGLGDLSSIPGGLWGAFIGVWLIAKGFSSSAFVSQPARTSNLTEPLVP